MGLRWKMLLTALLAAVGLPASAAPPSFFPRPVSTAPALPDYESHADHLRKTLPPAAGLTVVVQRPFVLVGDVPDDQMKLAQKTTQWAVELLRKDFFDKDPDRLIDIFIFKDQASFEKNSREILHEKPDTPFGFTTSTTIGINWASGNGTLVHELIHPFMATNFPKCPPWFNEGLAALYEQGTADSLGHLVGGTNWRLPLLQETLTGDGPKEEGPAPSFKDLCAMDTTKFYGPARMPNLGTARYLLYYLQEKGVLLQFYRDFVKNQKDDPTGYDTLQKTLAGLGEKDMGIFRKRWEVWVMGLTYP